MSRNIEVIDATAADFDALADLHAKCFDETWSRDVIARVLGMAGAYGLLARLGAQPTGFAVCRVAADECEILSIGVAPGHRCKGIGRRLVDAALEQAEARGAAALYLEVAEDNLAARALYAAAEFAVVSQRPGYYRRSGSAPAAAIVLRRDIPPHALRSRSR